MLVFHKWMVFLVEHPIVMEHEGQDPSHPWTNKQQEVRAAAVNTSWFCKLGHQHGGVDQKLICGPQVG